jgi:hypothetical protein
MTAENTAVQDITDADFVRVCRLDELPRWASPPPT